MADYDSIGSPDGTSGKGGFVVYVYAVTDPDGVRQHCHRVYGRYNPSVTRSRHNGQLNRHTALRARQQAFLRVLVDCSGSRARAIEASGEPAGTIFRWQSDPWFRERYDEIRQTLAGGAEALQASLMAASFAMAVGEYRGLMRSSDVRRSLDELDKPPPARLAEATWEGPLPTLEELEAEIQKLLRG